jgi:hypothetical protein
VSARDNPKLPASSGSPVQGLPVQEKRSAEDVLAAYRARYPGHARFLDDPNEPTIGEWDDPTDEKPLR